MKGSPVPGHGYSGPSQLNNLIKDAAKPDFPPGYTGMGERALQEYSPLRAVSPEKSVENEHSVDTALALGLSAQDGRDRMLVPRDYQDRVCRDLSTSSIAAGGALVGTNILSFTEAVTPRLTGDLGVTRLPGLKQNATIPILDSQGTTEWLNTEVDQMTESQQTFRQLPLTPKFVGTYIEVSEKLRLQAQAILDALLMQDMGMGLARALDTAIIAGSGADGQPTGIVNAVGVGSVSGGTFDFDAAQEFQSNIDAAIEDDSSVGWATNGTIARLLKTRHKVTDTFSPLWRGSWLDGTMDGLRGKSSTVVPASTLICGDWSQIVIAEWGALELRLNPFTNWPSAIIGISAIWSVDIGIRRPAAFSISQDVT